MDKPVGNRQDRWFDAYDGVRACVVPLVTVDSGWRWTCGTEEYRAVYSGLVNQALQRPALADLSASYTRTGIDLDVLVHVTNWSGTTLGPQNSATVNVLVVERTKVVHVTGFVRAANDEPITADLAHGAVGTYRVRVTNVPMGDWSRAVIVAMVDYRPGPSTRYESLQAAVAVEALPPSATPPATPTERSTPTEAAPIATATPATSATAPPNVTSMPSPWPSATATKQNLERLFAPLVELRRLR